MKLTGNVDNMVSNNRRDLGKIRESVALVEVCVLPSALYCWLIFSLVPLNTDKPRYLCQFLNANYLFVISYRKNY